MNAATKTTSVVVRRLRSRMPADTFFKRRARLALGPNPLRPHVSRRQLFANAAIAASRVGS
jgi:hypothetical protein